MNDEKSKARPYTTDEVREKYLELVWSYIDCWEIFPDKTERERMEGLAASMLVILDGGSTELPGFVVGPIPHKDDRKFHKDRGQNWFPENQDSLVNCDISGGLHELFYDIRRERKEKMATKDYVIYDPVKREVLERQAIDPAEIEAYLALWYPDRNVEVAEIARRSKEDGNG